MAADPEYDATLTARIRAELDEMGAPTAKEGSELERLIDRLDGEFRRLFADPSRQKRTAEFLRAPAGTSRPGAGLPGSSADPVRRTLGEIATMSSRLDSTTDASEGFAVAESVARRAHELSHTIEGFFSALDPAEAITTGFRRLGTLLSQLIRNAIAKLRAFARLLGISSFSIAFATLPPEFTVTFTFGGS